MKIQATNVFQRNWEAFNKEDITYIKNEGGTRSSKTYSICQMLILYAIKNPNKIIAVIRKHSKTIKDTVLKQDFIPMLKDMGLYNENNYNMSNSTYNFGNGTIFEFYGADDEQKLRGRKRDIAWLNEANELMWDDFKQIAMRTSGKIIIDYNPSAPTSFLYELPEDKTIQIHSTYKDNPFLSDSQIEFILDMKRTDPTGYDIYALGKRSISKENVYKLWDRVKGKPEHIKDFIYGLDFGFNHPTALIKIWYDTDTMDVFLEEMIYASNLTSGDLIDEMNRNGIDKGVSIVCDYARPEIIRDINNAGYSAVNADKSVKEGINAVRLFNIKLCENSLNIKKENELYRYKKVGDVITDEVIKKWDDGLDAIRYGLLYVKKYELRSGDDMEIMTFNF